MISCLKSLRPSDDKWRHWTGPTLAQIMARCLMAPSHYLNQCWLIISKFWQHSFEGNFTGNAQTIYLWYELKITNSRLQMPLPGANELRCLNALSNCTVANIWDSLDGEVYDGVILLQDECILGESLEKIGKLSHWGLNKMATIVKCIFLNEYCWIFIQISLKVCSWGPNHTGNNYWHWFRWGLGVIIWHCMLSPGVNELGSCYPELCSRKYRQ